VKKLIATLCMLAFACTLTLTIGCGGTTAKKVEGDGKPADKKDDAK
jgi:hypothetical protein